jgi:hypothetical protein
MFYQDNNENVWHCPENVLLESFLVSVGTRMGEDDWLQKGYAPNPRASSLSSSRMAHPKGSNRTVAESQVRYHLFNHLNMFVFFIFELLDQLPDHIDLALLRQFRIELKGTMFLCQSGIQYFFWSAQTSSVAHGVPPSVVLSFQRLLLATTVMAFI